jgi:hypothetical protein
MAGTGKKWLIGCGLGCGFFIALGLGLGAAGWYGVRHVARRAESIEATSDSLAVRFGPPESYAPPADGSLPADRLEAFLEARRLMEPVRERTSKTLAVLDGSGGSGVPARIAAGVNFVPQMLKFIEERDRALLAAGIGPGEYQYVYTVAYFGLLGKDPGDGPGFMVSGSGDGGEGRDWSERGWTFSTSSEGGGTDESKRETVRREREIALREELNHAQRENLRLQLAALDAAGGKPAPWRAALAAELEALDNERRRCAWEQGLPEATRASLEPFRDRFEASYDAMTGALELHLNADE